MWLSKKNNLLFSKAFTALERTCLDSRGEGMEEITIPFMVMFIVAAGASVVTRFFKHREIMRYARQGMYPPYQLTSTTAPTKSIKKGINTAAVGLGLTLGLSFLGDGPWMIAGLIPLFVGLGLLLTGWLEMRSGTVAQQPADWPDEPLPAEKQPSDL
ncbi:MAG: hypothetical protein ACI9EW_002124 [Cellvibrionaceae bacterium]